MPEPRSIPNPVAAVLFALTAGEITADQARARNRALRTELGDARYEALRVAGLSAHQRAWGA